MKQLINNFFINKKSNNSHIFILQKFILILLSNLSLSNKMKQEQYI